MHLDEPFNLIILKQFENITVLGITNADIEHAPKFLQALSRGELFPCLRSIVILAGSQFQRFDSFTQFLLSIPPTVINVAVHDACQVDDNGKPIRPNTNEIFAVSCVQFGERETSHIR